MTREIDAQELAQNVTHALLERDQATKSLGMNLLEVTSKSAKLAMTVRDDMLNGHQTCHGGFIFSLADSAFAFACNADNQQTVALACQITFTMPARLGDRLIANAFEVVRAGRTGVFDCIVEREEGGIVATFRGNSYRTGGQNIEI